MALYEYEIGTTYENMTNVESLDTPLDPPRHTFRPYSQAISLGDGSVRGGGWSVATWRWGFMSQAQYNAFKSAYCSGKSASVYINTWIDADADYTTFTAILIWPDEGDLEFINGRVLDVELVFVNLVEYSE
jgi:hypothetical protein